jgi:CheY-like chemotaxis protein
MKFFAEHLQPKGFAKILIGFPFEEWNSDCLIQPSTPPTSRCSMPSILLVEDSATQAMQMRILLESAGHEVTCAEDGVCAVECLANQPCELVITDLEMPQMNGLQLVERLRVDFPHIPSILVTARGSETLAAEALQKGAAGYVPKSMLESMLIKTVEDVLGVLRTDRTYAHLIDCTVQNHFILELPTDPTVIGPAVDLPIQIAAGMDLLNGVELHRLSTAIQEALQNAIYRGNLELSYDQWRAEEDFDETGMAVSPIVADRLNAAPYNERKVRYDVLINKDFIRIIITDQGPGFDITNLPIKGDPGSMVETCGRGFVLIQSLTDDVKFNPAGNQITLLKRCKIIKPDVEHTEPDAYSASSDGTMA